MAGTRLANAFGTELMPGPCKLRFQAGAAESVADPILTQVCHCLHRGKLRKGVCESSLQHGRTANKSSGFREWSRIDPHLQARGRSKAKVRAVLGDSNEEPPAWELKPGVPKEFWFAATEASKMILHGPQLETVLRDAVERAERSNLPRNTWLIFEPMFLEEHPGLKGVKKDMKGQVAAIVSTNQDWMIQIVKPMLPGVVIGKFRFPSKYIKDPLASSIRPNPDVPSGAGVWH